MGDLPPYEAFPIGGTNSVRGYSEGGVGSGRNYAAGTAELHFPLIKPLQVLPIHTMHMIPQEDVGLLQSLPLVSRGHTLHAVFDVPSQPLAARMSQCPCHIGAAAVT